MYGLLIADDEYQTRTGLRDLIDWETLGLRVLGVAEDGDTALTLLGNVNPDILITDVRMNRMDGLTLAREARAQKPEIEIVFISGYSDSEYLKGALEVEAFDYLYKPLRVAEIGKLMKKLISRLDGKRRAQEIVQKSRPIFIERLLSGWISGMLEDMETVSARMRLLDLPAPDAPFFAAAVMQPLWPCFPAGGQAEAYQMLLESAAREELRVPYICAEDTGVIALLPLREGEAPEAYGETLSAIARRARAFSDARLAIGISARHGDWTEVKAAVGEARKLVERRLSSEGDGILYPETDEKPPEALSEALDDAFIERDLLTGRFDALWEGVERMLGDADASESAADRARERMMRCALTADLALLQNGLAGLDALSFCRRAVGHMPLAAVRGALKDALFQACARVRGRRGQACSAAVERALETIRTRYAERLSVDALAEEAHYSPAHLSAIFRQETGTTLGEALLSARMAAATKLLRTTSQSVSAVAQSAGYADVQYFSRSFKRFTGMTPLEYRKRALPC